MVFKAAFWLAIFGCERDVNRRRECFGDLKSHYFIPHLPI